MSPGDPAIELIGREEHVHLHAMFVKEKRQSGFCHGLHAPDETLATIAQRKVECTSKTSETILRGYTSTSHVLRTA